MANKNRTAPEYRPTLYRAENEARTRDPQLGKLMLYQLSYFRMALPRVATVRLHAQAPSNRGSKGTINFETDARPQIPQLTHYTG